MPITSYAVKMSAEVKKLVQGYCERMGLKQGRFVEMALLEKIERDEDVEDAFEFERLRGQEKQAVSFEQYLKGRAKQNV